MNTIRTIYIASGFLTCLLALPLIAGRVPPNYFYGFRFRPTLDDPRVWYAVNRYFAWCLLITGVLTLGTAVAGPFLPGLSEDAFSLLCIGVLTAGVLISLVLGLIYMHAIRR